MIINGVIIAQNLLPHLGGPMDPWPYPPSLTVCLGLGVVIVFWFAGICWFYHGWLDLGVSCIQVGMEGLIRSNGLWQLVVLPNLKAPTAWSRSEAKTVIRPTVDLLGVGRSRSFKFNMCSQEGAKLLVKAWVELMQYLWRLGGSKNTTEGLETRWTEPWF